MDPSGGNVMNDWLHNLPIVWMAFLIFGLTALVTAAIYLVIRVLSVGERARLFKGVSGGYAGAAGRPFRSFRCVHRLVGLD